ncbi:glycosyltransferase WbpL [Steroidobacter agaridevorans]|uniref:Glycosyltransferase WbpL n=2 Tax=Steroidobacter agaridevorans TaxID=2695856 RepID=A0A829YH26_9GAMM|nr:glycosyltransferase WbpL [Steroidobacter agaridevorans]GFE85579.1 glycosyltransferase WbpL [Steroidobacter agaridevorans]
MAVLLTGGVRKIALSMQVLDIPNSRSSHAVPTPRGGGLATVLATTAVLGVLVWLDRVSLNVFMALSVGALAVATVGFLDDRRPLPARIRFTVHVIAAIWALAWLGGLPPLRFGEQVFTFGWGGYVLGVLGIVWTLNLFNFMDGIDGIAGSEAAFVAAAGALLHHFSGGSPEAILAASVFAAGCLGFLVWNWPPAKIFMGDVGSGYMGYIIAVLALIAARENPVALLLWVILGGVFFVDATVTLVRRVWRRESFHQAHRSHAYQWLSRRWKSHRRVTLAVLGINLTWLFPCALFATWKPAFAGWMTVVALLPVTVAAILAGAGRAEA